MMDLATSTSIARPAAEVFDYVADAGNEPHWHTDALAVTRTDAGPIGAGSSFAARMKPYRGVSEGTMTISAYEPPRRVVFEARMGTVLATITMTVEPADAACRVTRRIQMQPAGPMRLLAPLVAPMWRRQVAGHLANLKRVLEAG
jgi:uncharacterized protein YndB with AHSA1/START domain